MLQLHAGCCTGIEKTAVVVSCPVPVLCCLFSAPPLTHTPVALQEWAALMVKAAFTIKDGQRSIAWCSTKRPSRLSAKCIERMQQL